MNIRLIALVLLLMVILFSICLLFSRQIILPEGVYVDQLRNTDGTMTFTVKTVTYNGSYHPKNIGAIWITNSSNQFVKTIKVWAASRRSHLVKWVASSGNNTTGAVTSATINSHQLHTVTWNGKNTSNVAVPDGNYNINVEYTESASTTSNPGKYKVITFNKGNTPVDTVPTADAFFTTMHLTWAPVIVANEDQQNAPAMETLKQNYPNPFKESTSFDFFVKDNSNVTMNIYNTKGQLVAHVLNANQAKGWHKINWNRNLDNGHKAAPGKYICRLLIDNKTQSRVITISE